MKYNVAEGQIFKLGLYKVKFQILVIIALNLLHVNIQE